MKPTDQAFPGLTPSATPQRVQTFRTYRLPEQQPEFDEFCRDHHDGLTRKGVRRWKNPSKNLATLTFNLGQPRWLAEKDIPTAWPEYERRVCVIIASGAEVTLPETWSTGIVSVNQQTGEAIGGMCPWLRPLGIAPIKLGAGLSLPRPIDPKDTTPEPPKAA